MVRLLSKLTGLNEKDAPQAGFAFIFFFCILASYYIIQPLRDEIGLLVGEENTPALFVASMIAMVAANAVFAFLLNRHGRITLLKAVYRFFAANILIFILVFKYLESIGGMPSHGQAVKVTGFAFVAGSLYFLWVGIFNLCISSLFWALMADLYTGEQSKKVFGFLGAGGTLGQLAGSLLTKYLVKAFPDFHLTNLLFVSIILLELGVRAMLVITRNYEEPPRKPGEKKPSAFSGATDIARSPYLLGICLYLFLYSFISSFIYFQKQELVAAGISDRGGRVGFFSDVNIGVGVITLIIQLFVTGSFLSIIGVTAGLSMVPLVGILGFIALARKPELNTIFWLDVIRRTTNFAISRPSREVLFTVVPRREKYLAKNFIDTVVYRCGDTGAAGVYGLLFSPATPATVKSVCAILVSLVYLGAALGLGKAQAWRMAEQKAAELEQASRPTAPPPPPPDEG